MRSPTSARRTVFVCVAASAGTEAQAQSFMEKQWRHVTCDQAVQRLMGFDLLVTNRKDKEVQVHVLKNLNKQTAEFVTKFLTPLSGIVSLPLLTAFDKFLGSLGSVPLRDLAGDDVLSALLGRVSSDEFSALSTFQDSALELVAPQGFVLHAGGTGGFHSRCVGGSHCRKHEHSVPRVR